MSLPCLPLLFILLKLIFMRIGVELFLPQLKLSLPLLVEMLKLLVLHFVMPQLHIYRHGLHRRWLHHLLVPLQEALQLAVLLHDPLVLDANALLPVLLPVCCRCLQLLQPRVLLRVLGLGFLRWERRWYLLIRRW